MPLYVTPETGLKGTSPATGVQGLCQGAVPFSSMAMTLAANSS